MAILIRTENGAPIKGALVSRENFELLFPDEVFPPVLLPMHVDDKGFGLFSYAQQPKLGRYEKAVEIDPVKDERGIWVQQWEVAPVTPEEQQKVDELKAGTIRRQRLMRLFETDWSQLPDNQLTAAQKTAWTNYRQQLRDVPEQAGFPWDVTWPDKPA